MFSRISTHLRHCWLVALIAIAAGALAADPPTAAATARPALPADALGRDTPFGTVAGFNAAMNAGDEQRAARYLEGSGSEQRSKDTARLLKMVLDRGVTLTLDRLSRQTEGHLGDGLAAELEQIGTVKLEDDKDLAIILRRVPQTGAAPVWLYSTETLSRVSEAAAQLKPRLAERIWPEWVRQREFMSLPLFVWLNSLLAIPLSLLLARMLSRALNIGLGAAFQSRFGKPVTGALVGLSGPIFLLVLSLIVSSVAPFAGSLGTRVFWGSTGTVLGIAGLAWLLIRATTLAVEFKIGRLRETGQPGRIAVTELVKWSLAFLWLVAALILILRTLGFDVSTAVAGLGVGGIAVAFAAQKTIGDLFGTLMVISDEAIRVGDACRIGNVEGRVESIGLRSTRIRSKDRTLVSIPNGQLATMNIENLQRRDKFLCHQLFRLDRETTSDQLRRVLDGIRTMVGEHEGVEATTVRVRLIGFGEFSLDLDLRAHLLVKDRSGFLQIQEDLLLRTMDIVESCGTRLALPTRISVPARSRISPLLKQEPPS